MFVVTGGGSGIGRALALALAASNKSVMIIGRRQQQLSETAQGSPLISSCCADISTVEGRELVGAALQNAHQLEGLIHNAGIIQPIAPITAIDPFAWEQTLATNLNAPLFLSQQLIHKLKGGRVLHIGSGVAYFPVKGWAAYCVSKAALSMLTRCWQSECNDTAFASVMPGIIDTDMQGLIRDAQSMSADKAEFFNKLYEDNKLISPETVACFLTWLLIGVDERQFVSQEWDIYDKSHHHAWLTAPHTVPELE